MRGYKLIILLWLLPFLATSQTDTLEFRRGRQYRLYLNNGETATGFVIDQSGEYITLESRPMLVHREIRRSTIVKAEKLALRDSFEADVLGENPHHDLYMTAAATLTFEPNSLRSTGHWLIFDNIEYAFNKNWALHMSSLTFYPTALGLKCAFKLDDLNYIGGNVNAIAWFGENDGGFGLFGIFSQAKFTHGTTNRNFTIGAGFFSANRLILGLPNADELFLHMPLFSAGFCNRFAPRWSFVADGHVLPDEGVMIGGLGLKFLRDEYSAWTFGCYGLRNDNNNTFFSGWNPFSIPLPYLSYTRVLD